MIVNNAIEPGQCKDCVGQVDREKVESVHKYNPQKDSKRERRNKLPITVNDRLGLLFNELNHQFNACLQSARNTRGCLTGNRPENQDDQEAHRHRPEKRIEVDD